MKRKTKWTKRLVQHCTNNSEYSTCYLRQYRVVVSQQCHRIASFLRLVLSQISGTVFHCYLGNTVLGCCLTAVVITMLAVLSPMIQQTKVYAAEQTLPSGLEKAQLEDKIDAYVTEHQDTTAGMAVAVFDNADELLKKYYGNVDVENQIAVTQDSVFEWGSTTKLLVWVSVMQLYEQGKLELDSDIRNYLPEGFLTNLSYDTPLTMLNLMNHNAGFQECYVDLMVTDAEYITSLEEALRKHKPAQIYEPGTVTAYSNWGVALAGYIVERVSGMSFSEYVHENIFEPLQMEHSAVYMDLSDNEWVRQKRAELQCYTTERDLIPGCFYYITLYPAGMCTSTLDDFETFAAALLREDTALLKYPETWAELFSPSAYFGESGIASNCHGFWTVPFGVLTVGHGGNTAGCSSYLLLDRENQIGAVVMTNQSGEKIYNRGMMELVFGKYERSNYTDDNEIPPGGFRTARTVRRGPFKVMSLSYGNVDGDEDQLWIFDGSGKRNKIVYSYEDQIQTSLPLFLMEVGVLFLWIVAFGFSAVSLLARGIMRLIRHFRKRSAAGGRTKLGRHCTNSDALGRWSTAAAVLQLTALLFLILIIHNVSAYALGDTYIWMFAVLGVLALAMGALCVYGLVHNNKTDGQYLKKRQKVFNNVTAFFLLVAVVNVLYWNLFMFWEV